MKSGAHLQAPGPAGFEGSFVGDFMFLLDGIIVGDNNIFALGTVA